MLKKWIFLLLTFSLFAQEEDEKSIWDYHPIHIGGNAIICAPANIHAKESPLRGKLSFNKENLFLYAILPVSSDTFFLPRVEYNTFTMDWDQNPNFLETRFFYTQFALTLFTKALESWRWIVRADYNIDCKHFSSPREYGLFSALLWGTHQKNDTWAYHIGALGYTGFEGEEVYPVIGFDYHFADNWLIQLIFPINYSIEYGFAENWTLALKGKTLKERFRSGPDNPSPRSVFNYSATAAEINLSFEKPLRLDFEIFAGYNFGGDFYLKDSKGENALYTDLRSAPYFGASLNWGL